MISIYTKITQGEAWLERYRGCRPAFACVLGYTETGLIPGISAAGATPEARRYTALADAEFLIGGDKVKPKYPLPPLNVGISPVYISRAVLESLEIPIYLFNAGLPEPPSVSAVDLGGLPAACVSSGRALPLEIVHHLYHQGWLWGEKLAQVVSNSYLLIGECVVGGTTTALAILKGLGINAQGKVNSSHPLCNHAQKQQIVEQGLAKVGLNLNPFEIVAAVGDPMQIVAAGMAIAASLRVGVILAGGTQMLAVQALIAALSKYTRQRVNYEQILVGTTRWVAEDPSGDTVGLAKLIPSGCLVATKLSLKASAYPQLRVYEQGYVKEGVGAGGCAIAAHLSNNWTQVDLLAAIERLIKCSNQPN